MSGVTGAVVGAAVVGAGASVYSANKAAGAAKSAANSSIGEQQREYDQARADNAPYRVTGMSGLNQVAKLYGLDTSRKGPAKQTSRDSPPLLTTSLI
jgi:hypothetical protein